MLHLQKVPTFGKLRNLEGKEKAVNFAVGRGKMAFSVTTKQNHFTAIMQVNLC